MKFTDSILLHALIALLTAVAVALITTPIVKAIAPHIGALDVPKDDRRMHTKPIPLCGELRSFSDFPLPCCFSRK